MGMISPGTLFCCMGRIAPPTRIPKTPGTSRHVHDRGARITAARAAEVCGALGHSAASVGVGYSRDWGQAGVYVPRGAVYQGVWQ